MDVGKPKIVIFDIETLPDVKQVFKHLPAIDDWPGQSLKAQINSVLCIGYKTLEDKKCKILKAWDYPSWKDNKNNDAGLLEDFRKVLESADAIVTHNGRSFDFKFLQTRCVINGINPYPTNILHIDTKVVAKSNLYTLSNRLNNLAEITKSHKKLENGGWELWEKVWNDDEKALKLMERYCKQDVNTLEEIFMKLRPFIKNIPNHNLYNAEKTRCPNCGSLSLIKNGERVTKTKIMQRYRCSDCGSNSQLALRDMFIKGG